MWRLDINNWQVVSSGKNIIFRTLKLTRAFSIPPPTCWQLLPFSCRGRAGCYNLSNASVRSLSRTGGGGMGPRMGAEGYITRPMGGLTLGMTGLRAGCPMWARGIACMSGLLTQRERRCLCINAWQLHSHPNIRASLCTSVARND